MKTLTTQINSIVSKTERLAKAYDQLKDKHFKLEASYREAKEALDEERNRVSELNNQIKIIKLAKNISGANTENTKEIKRKIGELSREIDKCIALISD